MNQAVLPDNVTIHAAELDVHAIIVRARQREVSADHVSVLRDSFRETGKQLVPIAVSERPDGKLVLIDGAHRLEAAKQEGFERIRAEVYSNLAEDHEGVLEFVTNKARKDLSPAEILLAWETFELPMHELRVREKQVASVAAAREHRGNSGAPLIMHGVHNQGSEPALSLRQRTVEVTGHSPDWLDKVASIRNTSEDPEVPPAVREAAQRGFEKLKDPSTKVEPVFKAVEKVKEAVLRQAEDPEELMARDAEDRLDEMVRYTTLLQEKLDGDLREFLALAGRKDQMGRDMLRATRVALVRALTSIVVIECEISDNAPEALRSIGAEVTKLLSQESMKALNLRQEGSGSDHV